MSLLEKQLQAHRLKHGLSETPTAKRKPPPSILFSPQELQYHDDAAFAALGRHGIEEASALDPDIAASASLFDGRRVDRETLTRKANEYVDKDIRHLLRLLSPHLMTRGAQECIDALLHRYHVHRWNVDDLLACALPYHDSPMFTRLLQGLMIEGKPQWLWLRTFKEKPATLVRSALAKYCCKDLSVLNFIGGVVQETVKLHKTNRALSTFFAALWLDVLATVKHLTADLVEAAIPVVMAALRKPNLRDSFHAALVVVAALCIKTELEASAHSQLLDRAAKQLAGSHARPAAALLALMLQLQAPQPQPEAAIGFSDRALNSLAAAGPQALVDALPASIDCENLLAAVVEGCLFHVAMGKKESEDQSFQELVDGLLSDSVLVDSYAAPLALAALQAFCRALHAGATGDARQRAMAVLKAPLAALGRRQPLALGAALRRAADAAVRGGLPTEPLVELLESAGGGAVASSPGSTSSSTPIMPLMDALTQGSPEARKMAVEKAVQDLKASVGQEDDAPRQRLLASLVLQTVDDDSVEVAQVSLGLKALWSEVPQVDPASAVRVLELVLSRRLKDLQGVGSNLKEMFQHATQDARTTALLPLVLRCCSWVYGRTDCGADLRARIDAALLPLLFLCLVGLDLTLPASDQEQSKKLSELRTAVLEFCGASGHPSLARLQREGAVGSGSASSSASTGTAPGPLSRAVAQASDAASLLGLCSLAEAKPWPLPAPAEGGVAEDKAAARLPPLTGIFGGAAAQAAAAALLAAATPRVLGALGATAEAEQLAVRCSEACQCFARHQSFAKAGEGDCVETFRQLLQASLTGLCSLEALRRESAKGGTGAAEGRRRRKSGASGSAAGSTAAAGSEALKPALQGLLCLALERPRTLAAELRGAISGQLPVLRPALLRVALGPDSPEPRAGSLVRQGRPGVAKASTASATALLLVRSLLLSDGASDWTPDQSLLVPLVARLASAEAAEVRAAGLEVLTTLQGVEATAAGCWDSPLAVALRDAGMLRATGEVLPQKAWTAAEEQEVALQGLSAKAFSGVLEQLSAHRAEILQDCSGTALALSKALAGKGTGKAARIKEACAFWGIGLSMLTQDVMPSTLLAAIPAAGLLSGLAAPLQASVEDAVASLQSGAKVEAPVALRMAAVRVLGVFRRRAESALAAGAGEKARAAVAAEEEAAVAFMQEAALPFCKGLAEFLKGGGELSSDSVAELAELFCKGFPSAALGTAASGEFTAEAMTALFTLCVAASPPLAGGAAEEVEDAEGAGGKPMGPTARVLAAASKALADAQLSASLLQQIFAGFPLFKGKQLESASACIAAELMCKQVSGLKGDAAALGSGGGELLTALAALAKEAAVRYSHRLEKAGGVAEGAAEGMDGTVEQLLLAVAAQSEHLLGTLSASTAGSGKEVADLLSTVCGSISEVPKSLGKHLTAGMLIAIVRSCGALSPLVSAKAKLLASPLALEHPAPLRCCIQALTSYAQPLRADVLSLFKGHLKRLWRCPELPASADPALIVQWDSQAQARLRLLLHTLVLEKQQLIEQVDMGLCLSLAESAGASASMDFVMLLYLARRGPAAASSSARRKPKKRRAGESFAEELLAEVLPAQDDDTTADEALEMLMSLDSSTRCQCLATLSQTLSAMAFGMCQLADRVGREMALSWGPSLLPDVFLQRLDAARSFWVLNMGLQVASRFVSEHGLPSNLDEAEFSTNSLRPTTIAEEDERSGDGAVALSLCYVVWSVSMTAVLLDKVGAEEEPHAKVCRVQARKLRSLLLRSLAVNHPITFFRSICLAIRIPEFSPATPKGDIFSNKEFMNAEAYSVMTAAKEAMEERFAFHKEAGQDDTVDEESMATCLDLVGVATRHTCVRFLAGDAGSWPEDLALVCWSFLDAICRFGGKGSAEYVSKHCLPVAAGCLEQYAGKQATGGPSLQVAVVSCSYLETAITVLGHGLLDRLNIVAKPLLECAAIGSDEDADGEQDKQPHALQERALLTTTALVKSLGPFMSPFLERLLSLTAARAPAWKTALLEDLGLELVASVPKRLLLPALQTAVTAASQQWSSMGEDLESAVVQIELGVVRMQRLSAILVWTFSEASPEAAALDTDGVAAALLRLLAGGGAAAAAFLSAGGEPDELPRRIFKRDLKANSGGKASSEPKWTEGCSKPSALRLNELAAAAFAKFSICLEFDDLKPRFSRVLEWARNTQAHTLERQAGRKASAEADPAVDTEDASRLVALCAAMRGLVGEAPDVAEQLFLPLATKDLAAALGASRRCAMQLAAQLRPAAKKRRRSGVGSGPRAAAEVLGGHTWWWFEVASSVLDFLASALRPVAKNSDHTKVVEEAIETLLEPCVNVLDIFEFLPGAEESELSAALCKAVQAALVVLAGACDSAHMKRLLTAVLAKSRSDDVEVRLCSVRCCHKIWTELGVQAASGLSEVVMYASELLEDEDSRVEAAVRVMVKTMEECTGESLQDALKH